MKKAIAYILLLFCFFNRTIAQTNLVPNYSFETLISCPNNQGITFFSYTPPWFSPNLNTPDIWNACAVNPYLSVPNTGIGYQLAHTGVGFGGFGRYANDNITDLLSVKLINPMIAGQKYCVSFFVNPGNYTQMCTDAIGAYISMDSIHQNNYEILPFIPQIENQLGNIISDTVNWTEISGEYTASGGEQFITIGSFYDTSVIHWAYNDTIHFGIYPYYFLDDVFVYLCNDKVPANAGNNKTICKGDSVQIGATPKSEYTYLWQPATGLSNANIANPQAKPNATTTYILQQTDFMNEITYDSVIITVINCDTVNPIIPVPNELIIINAFTPNYDGVNDLFHINGTNFKEINATVFNRWGQELYTWNELTGGWNGKYKGKEVSAGTYFYVVTVVYDDGKTEERHGAVTLVR